MPEVVFTTPANLPGLTERIAEAERLFGRPEPILKAFGVTVLGWIGDTFRAQGRPGWTPLRPRTLAARRQGKGAGSGRILQNTGKLRSSFDYRLTGDRRVTVFSSDPVAIFHEFGTKGPYIIRAKPGHFLALPGLEDRGDGTGRIKGQKSLSGFGRGRSTGRGSFALPANAPHPRAGKTAAPYKNVTFRQQVTHPGLPARPMLPTPEQITPKLTEAAQKLIHLALTRHG